MGAGVVTTGFPTYTDYVSDASPGVAPDAGDMNGIVGDLRALAVPSFGRFLRYDTTLVADEQWHACRFSTVQWDVDAQGGYLSPDLHAGAGFTETFTINTTGVYAIKATERFACADNTGFVYFRVLIVGGSELDRDTVPFVAENWYTARIDTEHYLTAGQQLQFQHYAFSGTTSLTIDDANPRPWCTIRRVGQLTS